MPANDLSLLIDAAKEAGRIAMTFWRDDPETWSKPDDAGPVTEADLAVDAMLRGDLMAARSDYGWLSEETEDDPERLSRDTLFVVDPIDGTRAFVAGQKTWAHSIAVVQNGTPTAAVVYLPARDLLYTATADSAELNGAPIVASRRQHIEDAAVLAAKPNYATHFWKGGTVPPVTRHFRSSLAYRLSLVAEGRFDAMLTLRPTWEWDIAAGALLATSAGASVSDQNGEPLRFNNADPRLPGIIAGAPNVHAGLRNRLA